METEELRDIGEILDRLLSVPVFTGSSLTRKPALLELYQSARDRFEHPLSYLAAREILERVQKGDRVLLITGFVVPPWLRAEHDGPAGAVTLARALNLGLDAVPVIAGEKQVIERMAPLAEACGFEVSPYAEAEAFPRRLALSELPVDDEAARRWAVEILDETRPSMIITIEKASPNEKGVYHSGVGYDMTPVAGKVQYVMAEAADRGIYTVGIGDGGNEVGMGCIKETVKRVLPTGSSCGCPCGAGTHSDIATDLLMVAMVSNWGCYAIEALLAVARGRTEIMHDRTLEDRVFNAAVSAGYIDPAAGFAMDCGDAVDKNVHLAMVDIMRFIVKSRIEDSVYIEKYKEHVSESRDQIQESIVQWAQRLNTR